MAPPRVSARTLRDLLIVEQPPVARLVRQVRQLVLATIPRAAEALKFRVLCYFHEDAFFGAIGGNICMIEVKDGRRCVRHVTLSFIHGALLPDPRGLLHGSAKCKRFVPIPDLAAAQRPEVVALLRAARDLRPWD